MKNLSGTQKISVAILPLQLGTVMPNQIDYMEEISPTRIIQVNKKSIQGMLWASNA